VEGSDINEIISNLYQEQEDRLDCKNQCKYLSGFYITVFCKNDLEYTNAKIFLADPLFWT